MPETAVAPPPLAPPPAHELLERLRATFRSGRTRPLEWRRTQLEALLRLLDENGDELLGARHADLRKPALEGYGADVGASAVEIRYVLKHLKSWAKPRRVLPSVAAL